jgi:transposase
MFIKVTSSGGRRYAQLVESYRNESGSPRQRTICTLGRVEPGGDVDKLIAGLQRAQGATGTSEAVSDPLAGLQFLDARAAGDVWALSQLWQSLGLDELALAWRRSRCQLDVLALFRAMVFNRLCDPQSKLGVLRWLDTVALPVGFGLDEDAPMHQHLLRAMDVIDEHHEALRDRMALLMRPLIDQDLSLVFYDLTTVQAAGMSEVQGDVRAHGKAKSGLIERQFMLSLVQTADGLPIDHQVHPGNTAEARTLLPMIRALVARYPLKRVVLVADRGLLSLSNLDELSQLQDTLQAEGIKIRLEYILAVPAARYGEFAQSLRVMVKAQEPQTSWVSELDWQSRRLIVAHDPEVALRRTQERRKQIDELVKQGQEWGGQLDAQDAGQKRRGRPLSDSGAKARLYHAVKEANVANLIKVDLKHEEFSFTVDEERQRYLELLDGKLLLVTNTDTPAAQVVTHYKSLADIERGFRVLKSDIEIGPVYHRLPQRIRAHAMVCFVALVLYRVMRMRLKASKREESPTRLLEQLRRIQHQTAKAQDGRKISGLTEINAEQKSLLSALKLAVPTPGAMQNPHL